MKRNRTLLVGICACLLSYCAQAQLAYDNASLYPNNPDNGWPGNNGGFGYNLWTPLADTSGGGTYMEGIDANNRQVDGNFSFALYAGNGSYDISRPLSTNLAFAQFSILTRFDLAGSGPNLVNLRAGNDTSSFGASELLSFGIVNNNQLCYTDGSGFHTLSSGEARGAVWDWIIDFNAAAGVYVLNVTNLSGGYATTVIGYLETNNTSVGSFAVINASTGANQNLIFDSPEFDYIGTGIPGSLSISLAGTNVVVTSTNYLVPLQSATVVNGTNSGFADLPGPVVLGGPYTNTNTAPMTFFRLRN